MPAPATRHPTAAASPPLTFAPYQTPVCRSAGSPARAPRSRVVGLVALCALLLLSGCWSISADESGRNTAQGADAPSSPPQLVEVTRVVVTERIVTATPEPPIPCTPPPLNEAEEVVVAALLPLSMAGALPGTMSVQVALNLAAAEINANGGIAGKPLRLWFADASGSAEQATAAAHRAIAEECAVALLMTQPAESIAAVARATQATGTPLLVLEAGEDSLTAVSAPHLFRLAPAHTMLATMYSDWLAAVGDYNGDGARETLMVIEGTAMGRAFASMIGAALEADDISADTLEVDLPRSDFSSLIARIVVRETAPDAILIRFGGESATTFQRQLVENGIGPARKTVLVATRQALTAESFWPQVGEAGAYTVVGRAGPWASTVNTRGAAFAESFGAWLERWPDTSAFLAYDALYLLTDAVARAASLGPADLTLAMETSNLAGAAGRYTFPVGSLTAPGGAESVGQPAWAWHQWMEPPLLFLQYTVAGQPAEEMAVIWPPTLAGAQGPIVRPASP